MITEQTAHRLWPLPQGPWVLFMRWHDLLFLHWPVDAELMRSLISPEVELETYGGLAWLGIIPFRMSGVRPRCTPFELDIAELNVRTYVKSTARSGVWFFSLDANSRLAVRAARSFGLPYYDARMSVQCDDIKVEHRSFRIHRSAPAAEFIASYRPVGPIFNAAPGSFEHWLTERYALYGARKPSKVVYGEIHHQPWPLQRAEVELRKNTMVEALGIQMPHSEPVCHFARYQEVVAWPIVPLRRANY